VSGIAGIVNLDGAPVDPSILSRMVESIAFRGPDAQHTRIEGHAGFGHTLLKTTDEAERERQPLSMDGDVWIVADARVDARSDLIRDLRARGEDVAGDSPDVELILRSYRVWQENCVEHLLGDFAFGIWDARRRRLFCARDHLGVKSLYYAWDGKCVVFSNTLECVRRHPSVSDRLNDLAVADFLLFDLNQDKATTTFADVQRVPPAHSATWSETGLQVRRYWTLPIDEPLFYRRIDDYVDRFRELLTVAVSDRLRTDRVGVSMSGGLDSTTLAATARDLLQDRSGNSGVRAFTVAFEGHEERHYASLVAESLGIAIEFSDNAQGFDPQWFRRSFHTPEPTPWPTNLAAEWSNFRRMNSYCRVALYGEGPDNALRYEWRPYFEYLIRHRRYGRLIYDLFSHMAIHRRIPVPAFLRMTSGEGQLKKSNQPFYPEWLNPDLELRLDLRSRWERRQSREASVHHFRPIGYGSFENPAWQELFSILEAERTRSPLEVRHPFLDLRLLRYMLAVPAVPWCRSKYLMRRAMRERLPTLVLRRPKTPVVQDLWGQRVKEAGLPPLVASPMLAFYVNSAKIQLTPTEGTDSFWVDFRMRSLNYWLRNVNSDGTLPV